MGLEGENAISKSILFKVTSQIIVQGMKSNTLSLSQEQKLFKNKPKPRQKEENN